KNILTLDGGSTTTKASLVQELAPTTGTEHYVQRDENNPGYPVFVPTVEVVEVGNGGTSIAWIDGIGNVRVGPIAAGALPGPASSKSVRSSSLPSRPESFPRGVCS